MSEETKKPVDEETKKPVQVTFKVAARGGVSVYGLQRMPITLYATQWIHLEGVMDQILGFIEEHKSELAWKDETPAQ